MKREPLSKVMKRSHRCMGWSSTGAGRSSSNTYLTGRREFFRVGRSSETFDRQNTDRFPVRLKVQFQAVLDAFPNDTTFSFTSPSDISEAAIAMATMHLPRNQGSLTSSTSSLRKRRLKEISEDAEENVVPVQEAYKESNLRRENTLDEKPVVVDKPEDIPPLHVEEDHAPDELPASAIRAKALLARRKEVEAEKFSAQVAAAAFPMPPASPEGKSQRLPHSEVLALSAKSTVLTTSPPTDKSLPATPQGTPPQTPAEPFSRDARPSQDNATDSPEGSRPSLTAERLEHAQRLSNHEDNGIGRWTTDVATYADFKPKKKKLAPRPHVETKRPRTSGTSDESGRIRPVANLPTTVRVSERRPPPVNGNSLRPSSQQSSRSVPGRFAGSSHAPNIMPPLPSPVHLTSLYRPESRRSTSQAPSVAADGSTVTPEKMRLMKALQLRKRNMLVNQRTSASTATSAHTHSGSLASSNTSRGIDPANSTMKSDSNGFLAEPAESSKIQTSNTTSPTSATQSENHSHAASSFTSQEAIVKRKESLSSDTSSSITPRADASTNKRRSTRSKRHSAKLEAPSSTSTEVPLAGKPETQGIPDDTSPSYEIENMARANQLSDALAKSAQEETAPLSKPTQQFPPISRNSTASRSKRGQHVPEPLRVPAPGDVSEVSDGESFMDELEHATVHEAKPVSVARTPVTPVMSKIAGWKDPSRSVSTPVAPPQSSTDSLTKTKSSGGRSASTALPAWPPASAEQAPVPLTKKSTLGSGISKRIKALETVTTRNTSPPRQAVKPEPSTRSAFTNFMKRSSMIMHPQSNAPNTSTDTLPARRSPGSTASPDRERTPQAARPWVQQSGSNTQVLTPTQKGETISVTARIIRDFDNEDVPAPKTAPGDINLHRSPLIVEHERQDENRPRLPRDYSAVTIDSSMRDLDQGDKSGRFSFASHRSMSAPRLNTADSTTSKMSSFMNSGRKAFTKSTSDHSSLSEDKPKASRATRLMQRVSNLKGGRKISRNMFSSTSTDLGKDQAQYGRSAVIEERNEPDSRHPSLADSLLHVVDIGDVNVQFPESLLWKRRFIRIDDQGYLIFSPPANDTTSRSVARKYHLSDFRVPALPDAEREEMAWSVILDMRDGSCVQCACENKSTQQQVLQSKCSRGICVSSTNLNSACRCTQRISSTVRRFVRGVWF